VLADRRLRATLLPRRRDAWLLVQNHLKRDPAARVVIDWVRDCFQGISKGIAASRADLRWSSAAHFGRQQCRFEDAMWRCASHHLGYFG
jgi:hypothetical protein